MPAEASVAKSVYISRYALSPLRHSSGGSMHLTGVQFLTLELEEEHEMREGMEEVV